MCSLMGIVGALMIQVGLDISAKPGSSSAGIPAVSKES